MSQILISAAAHSNYDGMTALVDKEDNVYLGKAENYHFTPSTRTSPGVAYYDNSDGSLAFISDNVKMFHFLYGEGWVLPQEVMLREHYFRKQDYREFARLREGALARYSLKRSPNRTAFFHSSRGVALATPHHLRKGSDDCVPH